MLVRITETGKNYLRHAPASGNMFDPVNHLRSQLKDGQAHDTSEFEKHKYVKPTLEDAVSELLREKHIEVVV